MAGIHNEVMNSILLHLKYAMIDSLEVSDITRAGYIGLGPLQGDPDPDEARISITIHENDPDQFMSGAPTSQERRWWDDEVEEVEIGGIVTTKRKFVVKIRCLFEKTRETLAQARETASIVRSRLERELPRISFSGISEEGEYVSRGILSKEMFGEMIQSGGPPDAYDYIIKMQFTILTTQTNIS